MLIGITGKKRAGKDTAAEPLTESGYQLYRFADPIKRLCADIFLWDDEWINGKFKETVDPRWGISPREAAQYVGTELFRQRLPELCEPFNLVIGSNIWVERFKLWYDGQSDCVIPDVRFLNEAQAIREMGGIIIRINREECKDTDTHASEKEMDLIWSDIDISNTGTIKELQDHIRMMYGGDN